MKGGVSVTEFTQPSTLVIKATQTDNPDRYSLTTLTVSGRFTLSSGEISFLRKLYSSSVLENMPLNSVILTVVTTIRNDHRVQFYIEPLDLPGKEFSVSQRGDIVLRKHLDYETTEGYSFRVVATDGQYNETTRVNISGSKIYVSSV